jgi:hypothetical protein
MTMSLLANEGPTTVGMEVDSESYMTIKVTFRCVSSDLTDGPYNAFNTPGLPAFGAPWQFNDEYNAWMYRTWETIVKSVVEGEPNQFWDVTLTFTTKPVDLDYFVDEPITDPLLVPPRTSGGLSKYSEEATTDMFGRPIVNSSWEQLRGPQVEFDRNRDTVKIILNLSLLQGYLLTQFRDTVNDEPLWGFPARAVKLSDYKWNPRFYGAGEQYYIVTLTFETNVMQDPQTGAWVGGFDRNILDQGTKALNGHWDTTPGVGTGNWIVDNLGSVTPSPANPANFVRVKDAKGENMPVVLNGAGVPVVGQMYGTIESAVWGVLNEANITSTGHGLTSGLYVAVAMILDCLPPGTSLPYAGGCDDCLLNGVFQVSVTDANHFLLLNTPDQVTGVICNGGTWQRVTGGPGNINIKKYTESNFLLLGIPVVL